MITFGCLMSVDLYHLNIPYYETQKNTDKDMYNHYK